MRKIIIALSCCTLVILLGYASYRSYQVWKQTNWLSLAKKFASHGDIRNEVLSLDNVLRTNPRNLDACRMMAGLAEAGHLPDAVNWRAAVVELNPSSDDDRLALAQTALSFKQFGVATNALNGLSASGKSTFAYHNLSGVICISLGEPDAAEAHFTEAARIEPENPTPQLNLAVVRLHQSNQLDMAEARINLKRISINSTNEAIRLQAQRELIGDAMHTKDTAAALSLSQELVQDTNSSVQDRLLRLEVLLETKDSEFKPTLNSYRHEAANDLGTALALADWQIKRVSPADTLPWLERLPANVETNKWIELITAQCRTMVGDWSGIQKTLQDQSWADWDYKRHAFLAYALREQELNEASKAEWEVALKGANAPRTTVVELEPNAKLHELLLLAAEWRWEAEGEDILWTIVNRYPGDRTAPIILNKIFLSGGRTKSLMLLFQQESKLFPSNLYMKNNLAMTAMLLNEQDLMPYALASDVYKSAPTNPDFISTYAFSLYLQGKYTEALKVMETLKPQNLRDGSNAGYYGLILKATGNAAAAKTYLDMALNANAHPLPEERKLFEAVRSGI